MSENPAYAALYRIATQLETWAAASLSGGWSTHQVEPQRRLASQIYAALGSGDMSRILESKVINRDLKS